MACESPLKRKNTMTNADRPTWLVPLTPEEDEQLARDLKACQDCTGTCKVCTIS